MKTIEERLYELEQKEKKRIEKQAEATIKYLSSHPAKKLYYSAKNNAKTRGIEFSITEEDINIPTHCPLLGVELTNTYGEGRVFSNISLDRIDNTKGYTPDNIQVICDLANRMKQDATPEQLVSFAKNILIQYKNV